MIPITIEATVNIDGDYDDAVASADEIRDALRELLNHHGENDLIVSARDYEAEHNDNTFDLLRETD